MKRNLVTWLYSPIRAAKILFGSTLIRPDFTKPTKKAEIGKRKYRIYYKKGILMVKSGIKKAEFHFKAVKNQVCFINYFCCEMLSDCIICKYRCNAVYR